MSGLSIGFAAGVLEDPATGRAPRWAEMRRWAELSESHALDTFWVPDELLWESEKDPNSTSGWWECVSILGAIAASTTTIQIGSWVLSALHRNPGVTVKVAEALDEVSDGRFIFGFGSGHAGRQGEAFGFPLDKTVGRYEEALQVVVPLLREGRVDFSGEFHAAVRQQSRPRGPSCGAIPLMLGAHGPRTMRLAVEHADIWSGYATTSSQPEAFEERLKLLDEVCARHGRDPKDIGRSVGVMLIPPGAEPGFLTSTNEPIVGSVQDIAETFLRFGDMGVDSIEVMVDCDPVEAIPILGEVAEIVRR